MLVALGLIRRVDQMAGMPVLDLASGQQARQG